MRQQTAYGMFIILHFTTLAAGKGKCWGFRSTAGPTGSGDK